MAPSLCSPARLASVKILSAASKAAAHIRKLPCVRMGKLARSTGPTLFVHGLCSNFDILFPRDVRRALDRLSAAVSPKGSAKNCV